MKKVITIIFILSCMLYSANSAMALNMDSVDGYWDNPVDGDYINFDDGVAVIYGNGLQDQIRWGEDIGDPNPQSGLGFTGVEDDTDIPIGDAFEIGQLVHFNYPILTGTAVTAVDLEITLQFGAYYYPFTFTLDVNETPNLPGPPMSDDIITFPTSIASETVDIGGTDYSLQLLGFGDDPENPEEQFISPEGTENDTLLWGMLVPISVDIQKYVNGEDADIEAEAPTVPVPSVVTFDFIVTNTGGVELTNIVVTDDVYGEIGTIDSLLPLASETLTLTVPAVAGLHTNNATVETDEGATDTDPANYYGEEEQTGDEGCTPGFWKNNADKKGAVAWVGYTPTQKFSTVFGVAQFTIKGNGKATITNPSLSESLGANGSGINLLARSAVAALLNASNGDINYPMSVGDIIDAVQDAINDIVDPDAAIQALGEELDEYNNYGCPINQDGEPILY